jgi:hypothetical protein
MSEERTSHLALADWTTMFSTSILSPGLRSGWKGSRAMVSRVMWHSFTSSFTPRSMSIFSAFSDTPFLPITLLIDNSQP